MPTVYESLPRAMTAALTIPNEANPDGGPVTMVDGLYAVARALDRIAAALEQRPATTRETT